MALNIQNRYNRTTPISTNKKHIFGSQATNSPEMTGFSKHLIKYSLGATLTLILVFVFFIWPGIWSGKNNSTTEENTYDYRLEKVKEFKINSVNPVELIDYYPPKGLYLGYTITPDGLEITLVNEEGEIVISKNMQGEGPEQYTSSLNCLAFSPEGNIWAITNVHFLKYSQQLHIKEKTTYTPNIAITLYDRAELLSFFYENNTIDKTSFIINPSKVPIHNLDHDFQKNNMIEIYQWGENSTYEIAPISDRSIAGNIDVSISHMYAPVYTIDRKNSKLYLTGTLDNEITVYDLNTQKITERIKIDHGDFLNLNTKLTKWNIPTYNNKILLLSKNDKIIKLDDEMLILDYITTISEGIFEQKKLNDSGYYLHYFDPDYHKLIVFDGNMQVTKDLPMPSNGTLTAGLPGNRLLVKIENKYMEEDFIRYGIYKLTKK